MDGYMDGYMDGSPKTVGEDNQLEVGGVVCKPKLVKRFGLGLCKCALCLGQAIQYLTHYLTNHN